MEDDQSTEEVIKLGTAIWRLALVGKSRDAIALQLGISPQQLDQTLKAYQKRLSLSLDQYRNADNPKIDSVIKSWLPLALARLELSGQVLEANDFDSVLSLLTQASVSPSTKAKT